MRKHLHLRVAEIAGEHAHGERLALDENPYPEGSASHLAWERGWQRAADEDHEATVAREVVREDRRRWREMTKEQRATLEEEGQ
jgi:hypothetical protein